MWSQPKVFLLHVHTQRKGCEVPVLEQKIVLDIFGLTSSDFQFKSSFRVRVTTLAWLASSRVGSSTKAPGPMRDHVLEEMFPQDQPTTSMDLILYHVAFNPHLTIPIGWPNGPQMCWQVFHTHGTPFWCRRTTRDCWIYPGMHYNKLQVAMMSYLADDIHLDVT